MAVRNAAPKEKPYKLTDGHGMYLLVHPNGGRYWRVDYKVEGKRKTLALGVYPTVSLREARQALYEARSKIDGGFDPIALRRESAVKQAIIEATTFGLIGDEWIGKMVEKGAAEQTVAKNRWLLSLATAIYNRPISEIRPPELLAVLRRVEGTGRLETARRLRSVFSQVFRYAIATGRADDDPAIHLQGALTPPKVTHRAAPLTPDRIGALMRGIDSFAGHPVIKAAMQFGALTFVRPFELRHADWSEIDLKAGLWSIPAARTKMKRPHIVPLSRQAIVVLRGLLTIYDPKGLVFPSTRSDKRPLSENTINASLRQLGFTKDEATHHGFRRMASTTLNERGWNSDWIERQLAHVEENRIRGAYNAAEWLPDRTRMMQAWADMLDEFEMGDLIG